MNILEVKNLTKNFGGLTATSDITMNVEKNSITAVIGPNGAGKTTFFNMVTAVYKPTSGDILLNGKSLVGLKPHQVSQFGITRTFQNIRLFNEMTVLENVLVGMHQNLKSHWIGTLLQLPHIRKIEEAAKVEAYDILKYVGLEDYVNENAGNLAYGAQRRLEIGRAMAAKPKILLLDEPAAGMNPKETDRLTSLIHDLRTKLDVTIILIEHDMKLVMKISDYIYVLDHGELIASGKPDEIRTNKRVIEAYLGKGAVAND
ncbi:MULTISPECIES: ABC transporter ATP-binding protein [Sporolactobacillus]|uniref:Branched-chain amino acid transport system ATP-binding protein n=1 Tax=Sporolactobacillus nakayamae TaxID=269670 RepID=A0A1I2MZZ1_9BACL|nr:ABC transporter ATP-binding protein [Sporolactobacillus nakayamae]SFF96189.1 branched-chain amino acid transport system ATP-binding protein [Sporolactobacillus nakayamae]